MPSATQWPVITDYARVERKKVMIQQLKSMYLETKHSKPASLSDKDLNRLGIKLLPLDLKQPAHTGPTFFAPLSEREAPSFSWDIDDLDNAFTDPEGSDHSTVIGQDVSIYIASASHTFDRVKPDSVHTAWMDFIALKCYREDPSIPLCEYRNLGANHDFLVNDQIEASSLEYPHCKFQIIQDAEPQEPLRRSELIPILVIMRWRMGLWMYQPHEIFPVQVISLFGATGRILLAHFDGKQLCIRKSQFYTLDGKENAKNFELFARWRISDAVGDTEVQLPVNIKPQQVPAIRRVTRVK
ncbi:hypothetical protein PRK78_002218 [Emydomyces testavorans]|uniref:Uncharacterized protein n=1 Tax=Emydomyces testavorans TaxID=2070801 RepID=A0AAF0DFY0_9EURO|nr:hypothetical protein PRK78_002218 [Emydomyces testavorans]